MARKPSLPTHVDTVIVGGGPASLILSYILHGHIPYYVGKHHDDLLDSRLSKSPNLLNISPETYAHFSSSLRYSTQALPVNTLLDTLIRPNADTEIDPKPCMEWRREPARSVEHVILTSASHPGGQWVENSVDASWDIGTLSYSEMLSLPGYSYAQHYQRRHEHPLPDFERPSRADVTDYFAEYAIEVGIQDSLYTSVTVGGVARTKDGFFVESHGISCRHLVLASGIFSHNIGPGTEIMPLSNVHNDEHPLLVIGSGFSAADVILSTPPHRKIIHMFKWAPDSRPSPLRGCHQQAYPEYAAVYRQMKLAAACPKRSARANSPVARRKLNHFFGQREWSLVYEGLPNAKILQTVVTQEAAYTIIQLDSGTTIKREIGDFAYVVGRRGQLDYLKPQLLFELLDGTEYECQPAISSILISGRTLRAKVERSFEIAPSVYAIGSLAGDSLVRHACGGCVSVAGRIMGMTGPSQSSENGQVPSPLPLDTASVEAHKPTTGTAHEDLHLHRREEVAA